MHEFKSAILPELRNCQNLSLGAHCEQRHISKIVPALSILVYETTGTFVCEEKVGSVKVHNLEARPCTITRCVIVRCVIYFY